MKKSTKILALHTRFKCLCWLCSFAIISMWLKCRILLFWVFICLWSTKNISHFHRIGIEKLLGSHFENFFFFFFFFFVYDDDDDWKRISEYVQNCVHTRECVCVCNFSWAEIHTNTYTTAKRYIIHSEESMCVYVIVVTLSVAETLIKFTVCARVCVCNSVWVCAHMWV